SLSIGKPIRPSETLLFFDEIQVCPKAIIALRYFYEEMPELHVIAAGSLLDFAIEEVGVPVGRVSFLYMYPMSFIEFLLATEHALIANEIIHHKPDEALAPIIHDKILNLLGEYMLTGGMPEVISHWIKQRDLYACQQIQRDIINSYREDFGKYCTQFQIKYVELIFDRVPSLICQPFKFSHLASAYQKRELSPSLDLLIKANVIHKISRSSAQGIPLGAHIDFNQFKLFFVDIALCQNILGFSAKEWILDPIAHFINKGALCEALVGQEILAYADPHIKKDLYYWHRDAHGSQAEIDYVIANQGTLIPIEVKSGKGSTLKSMHAFLEQHPALLGVRFSIQNYSIFNRIASYPLYAVGALLTDRIETLDAFIQENK
ncbi:MAG TPA: ATP-binding protein, partial [Gammaproteobacteria bacterium]|nr:ATP-binding protein [Gammaproteobacteria bacterium]